MSAAPNPVLQVSGLRFSYPERHVFNGWSAAIGPGLTWLRGSNGSGKSTLLKLLAGALPPQAGQLRVWARAEAQAPMQAPGIDAAQQPLAYRREVFWCGPAAIAFDHLRPAEYFAFLRSLYPRFDAAVLAEQLGGFGLQPFLGTRLSKLSTGTQRKVWLAAALAVGTSVVLLDEPLNALDSASLRHLRSQLARCAAAPAAPAAPARAWLVASHEPPLEAGSPVDRISLIDLNP